MTAEPGAPQLNRRQQAKAATTLKVLEAARQAFASTPYHEVTVRGLMNTAGLSNGAIFASYRDKAELWRAAMGTEPPVDGPEVRAALPMLSALRALISLRGSNAQVESAEQLAAWEAAETAIALAEGRAQD